MPEISTRTSGAELASGRSAGSASVPAGLNKGGSAGAGVDGTADAAFASSSAENSGFMAILQV
jgi:hypothetical protein